VDETTLTPEEYAEAFGMDAWESYYQDMGEMPDTPMTDEDVDALAAREGFAEEVPL
jgi:hypothetical protein